MIKTLLSIIASIVFLCLLVPVLALSFEPKVTAPQPFSPQDISNLKKRLAKSNPFEFQRYKHQTFVFNEQLLNQSANFILAKASSAALKTQLTKGVAKTQGSIQIPDSYSKVSKNIFLNFSFDISPSENLFNISNVWIGYLPIPNWVTDRILPGAFERGVQRYPEYATLLGAVKKIDIAKNKFIVNYHWDEQLSKKIKTAGRNFLFPPDQQKLLGVYYRALGEMSRSFFWHKVGLQRIIWPIFALAKERSDAGADPIKENRAALFALGIMASGIRANPLLQDDNAEPFRKAYFFRLSLLKRRDLMKHFLISSALAVSTNKALSDTIGLSKELDDSDGGSGFSFADLLADRAGVKLAQVATESEASARKIQAFLSQKNIKETDFMPPYTKLPEPITALQFKQEYIDIHNEKYLFVEQELQQRIDSRSLYKK